MFYCSPSMFYVNTFNLVHICILQAVCCWKVWFWWDFCSSYFVFYITDCYQEYSELHMDTSECTWGQIFPRIIALNRIYQMSKKLLSGPFRHFHCVRKKTQEPNDRHCDDKSKQRHKLGWTTAASFLPLLFSQWLWCVTLYFCAGTSAAQIYWSVGRTRSQGSSYLLPQISLPLRQVSPHGSPGEMLLLPCTRTVLSEHSSTLCLWIVVLFLQWNEG